jgi:hypothetical protein
MEQSIMQYGKDQADRTSSDERTTISRNPEVRNADSLMRAKRESDANEIE